MRCNTRKKDTLMTRKNTKAVEVSFRDTCNAIAQDRVDAMILAIEESFARRDTFEGAAALDSSSSYAKNRNAVLANKVAVARFFCALNVTAAGVIERKVSANKMFNAKALKKIVELSRFAVLGERKIEKVMSAFTFCALAFDGAISNATNKNFLSSLDFSQIVNDSDLASYLADYQHAYISGGKDTQSSQARNVLDVLGLGSIVNVDNRSRGGIELNRAHPFFADFNAAFRK